jgi:drug/metabolite transporter (DMT)-like permease
VLVLFWPSLRAAKPDLLGEFLGLTASILWANFSHQMRFLSARLGGAEVAAHTMWMSGLGLLPFGLVEIAVRGIPINAGCLGALAFCVVFGGVIPYALWNNALRHWRTSQVVLFNNLIPLSTMAWAYCVLNEPVTPTFWPAMVLIVLGVLLGQADWPKLLGIPEGF